jgi:hypothetical protein
MERLRAAPKENRFPHFMEGVAALLQHLSRTMPELSHIEPARIVVVAGEARRSSRGSIKPLTFARRRSKDGFGRHKPVVKMRGKRMLYSITLRPLFFLASTPAARIETVIHELYHISPEFDGTLDEARRHACAGKTFNAHLRPLVKRYLKICPEEIWKAFSYDGEVWVQQWLERPAAQCLPSGKGRRLYTEAHLFEGKVRMRTKKSLRWPNRFH